MRAAAAPLLLAALLAATACAKQDANTVYVFMAKSANYDPAGKLTLSGLTPTVAGIGRAGDDSNVGRIPTANMFGPKKSMPIFANGSDVIVDGAGVNGAEKRIILSVGKPAYNAASNELKFDTATPITTEGGLDGVVDDVLERTPAALKADTTKAVKLDNVVVTVDSYVPQAKVRERKERSRGTRKAGLTETKSNASRSPPPVSFTGCHQSHQGQSGQLDDREKGGRRPRARPRRRCRRRRR